MRPVNKTCMYGPQHSKRSLFFFFFAKSLWTCHCSWPVFERDNQTPKGYQKGKKKRNADVQHQIPYTYFVHRFPLRKCSIAMTALH